METTAKAKNRRNWTARVLLGSLLCVLAFMLSACEEAGNTEEDICAFMEQIAADTEKSITDKDAQLARKAWSDLTEKGLYAVNNGVSEVGEAVGQLAATYSSLVSYCESGQDESLQTFLTTFAKEAEDLSQAIAAEGFNTEDLDGHIDAICALN